MMQNFLLDHYSWIVTLHVIAVISWMAAQLYLPRLFVYHVSASPGGELSETLKVMERRLLKAIMTPAMIASLIFGILLLWAKPQYVTENWFMLKFLALITLFATHGLCARNVRQFQKDENLKSARYFRVLNEIPTVALILLISAVIGVRGYAWAIA